MGIDVTLIVVHDLTPGGAAVADAEFALASHRDLVSHVAEEFELRGELVSGYVLPLFGPRISFDYYGNELWAGPPSLVTMKEGMREHNARIVDFILTVYPGRLVVPYFS